MSTYSKAKASNVGVANTVLLETMETGYVGLVYLIYLTNTIANTIFVDVWTEEDSVNNYILKNAGIAQGSSLVLDTPFWITAGEQVIVKSDKSSSLDAQINYIMTLDE